MKNYFLVGCVLMSSAMLSAQTKLWTLQDCIDYAMQNNITLQRSHLQKRSATEDVKGAKAALLPSLSASTNQSVGYRPWQDAGISTVTNGQVNSKVSKSYYNGSYSLSASWTVWDGGRNINTIRQDELAEQQAELSVQETANTIQEQIAQLYIQILYLSEAVNVSKASLVTSQTNEQRGREFVEVGKMSKADLAQLSAQRATDEYNIVAAQSSLANYMLQLKQLLELTGDDTFDVATPIATDDQALEAIPALQSVYEEALTARPEIASSQIAIKNSDVSVAIAKAGRMPTVRMSGGVGTGTNSLSGNGWGNQMKSSFDATAGVTVSIPLTDQRQTKTSVNKARLQQQQAVLALQDAQKKLYQTIEGYWLDANTNQQKFRAATVTVNSEQESYGLLSEQFRLGLKNTVELMTGKDKLLQAQQNQLQSKYLTLLNLKMLHFYAGGKLE